MLLVRRILKSGLVIGALVAAGCGGATMAPPEGSAAGRTGAAGAAGTSGTAGAAAPAGQAGTHAVLGQAPTTGAPPGVYLTSESATASGVSPCASTTLGTVLDAIRAGDPSLADIQTLYDPGTTTGDGNFIYAYDVGVLGFDIIFKRGLGDCLAGCTENDYQYFSTGAACRPMKVGHYHAAWGTGTCLTVDGAPMWSHPVPPDPITVCGADNSPRDLRGTYAVHAQGSRTPCSTAPASATPLDANIQLVIEQNSGDLANGFVTFTSTGDPLVDGVRLPAQFQRQRFDAALMTSLPPDTCPRSASMPPGW